MVDRDNSPLVNNDVMISGLTNTSHNSNSKCCLSEVCVWKTNEKSTDDLQSIENQESMESQISSISFNAFKNLHEIDEDDVILSSPLELSKSFEDAVQFRPKPIDENLPTIKEIYVLNRHHQASALGDHKKEDPEAARAKYSRFREKRFICDECDRRFTLKQNVQMHIFQYHHPNKPPGKPIRAMLLRYQCTKCDKVFRRHDMAFRHEAKEHSGKSDNTVYSCECCTRKYSTEHQLKEHVDIVHKNLRPFECDQCDLKFGRAGGLRRHALMVHDKKLYMCVYEGCKHPGYKCTKALAAHVRAVHTLDRPFACLYCDKTFVRKNDLRVHEQVHVNHGFSCKKCGLYYQRYGSLWKHEKKCDGNKRILTIDSEESSQIDDTEIKSADEADEKEDTCDEEKDEVVISDDKVDEPLTRRKKGRPPKKKNADDEYRPPGKRGRKKRSVI